MNKLLLLILILAPVSLLAQQTATNPDWDKLVDNFFTTYFHYAPSAATAAGFHEHDRELGDFTRAAIDAEIKDSHALLDRFEKFDASNLPLSAQQDRELVISSLQAALLELETVRGWQKNPDRYTSGITNAIFLLMARKFAPAPDRLQLVIARERQIPAALDAARQNLQHPPRIYTEIAIEQMPGIIGFFQKDVPEAFTSVRDAQLRTDFQQANTKTIAALQSYEQWLKQDLLPRSDGDYRLGAEIYAKKLLYDEMIDVPLPRLLQIAYDDLRRNQERLRTVAAELDPTKTPQQIMQELEKDHPSGAQLIPTFRNTLGGLRSFIEKKQIVTIPSRVPPIVEETPPFLRALTTASMDTPGPYEKVAKEAFFNVTLPEAKWTPQQTEEYLEGFNRGTIVSTAVHEVYPGHYAQFLWVQSAPSKVRKLLGAGSNAEGWAHYTEQMMLDEGYGRTPGVAEEKDTAFLKLRAGQLQDALLRDARFVCGIEMHTGQMTMEQCRDFFVKEGFQVGPVADKEAKRGTSDPTYLVYTVGKLAIMKLRDDLRQKQGDKFSLRDFHNQFLQQGYPPIKLIRRAMLGEDSPVL